MTKLLPGTGAMSALVAPMGGIVEACSRLPVRGRGLASLPASSCKTGRLGIAYPAEGGLRSVGWVDDQSSGTAVDFRTAAADTRALGEALERYATAIVLPGEFITARQSELGGDALDLAAVPRCSEAEYQDPKCPLRQADPDAPIRWIRGMSLTRGADVWIPLALTHHYVRLWEAERFWLPISTGVAAHTDLAQAALSGLLEVVERDAIALTWLTRPALHRINVDADLVDIELLGELEASDSFYELYDATTDLNIPVVYGVQHREHHPTLANLVACAAGLRRDRVTTKVLVELVQLNLVNWPDQILPDDPRDFMRLEDGAVYMAGAERNRAFDFLRKPERPVTARPHLEDVQEGTPGQTLRRILSHLADRGHEVFAVNLTTDDLAAHGFSVVRVIVPSLMPMSPVYRARFLGHDRLRTFWRSAREESFDESLVNPFPQPFA